MFDRYIEKPVSDTDQFPIQQLTLQLAFCHVRYEFEAIDTVQKGGRPRGTDPESYRLVRPNDRIVPPGQDWRPIFEKELVAPW